MFHGKRFIHQWGLFLVLALSSVFQVSTTLQAEESEESDPVRSFQGLLALYDFSDGEGNLVEDRSGAGRPLHLTINNGAGIEWLEDALRVKSSTVIQSLESAGALNSAIQFTGEISIEVWARPAKLGQSGPARVVTLSKNGSERDFTLGQDGSKWDFRLRTTETTGNGIPSTTSKDNSVQAELAHVIYTRDRNGICRFYINGQLNSEKRVGGGLTNWDNSYRLGVANEISGDRPWLGDLHLVAIYNRSLAPTEVTQHFQLGADDPGNLPDGVKEPVELTEADQSIQLFKNHVAPIFAAHCIECHDPVTREGKLDLTQRITAMAERRKGNAVTPHSLEMSRVWEMVDSDEMPEDRPPLSAEQKESLRRWIETGAEWSVEVIDPTLYQLDPGSPTLWPRRLTVREYIETIRAAVGVDIESEAMEWAPKDLRADGFSNTAYNLTVDLKHVEAYARLAEVVARRIDWEGFLSARVRCREVTERCIDQAVRDIGEWLFRGAIEDRERDVFANLARTVVHAGGDFREAMQYVVEGMLQSPRFLYRIEKQLGDGSRWPVGYFELASRMSYVIWGASPDDQLIQAAKSGQLFSREGILNEVNRMLEDPRARQRSAQFLHEWLNLGRLKNLKPNREKYPEWKKELAEDMNRETLDFFEEVVWNQKRPVADLFNAQFSSLTPELARHYGIESKGEGRQQYDLSQIPGRGGILTQGSTLTVGGDEASMVARGLFVLHDLLRGMVKDPPPCVDTTPTPSKQGLTQRGIALERINNPSCGGCHSKFEPLAFGLEKFDGLGSYHEKDEYGNELKEDGEIIIPGAATSILYQTADELMDALASNLRALETITWKLAQFALGRPLVAEDAPLVKSAHEAAMEAGGRYEDLIRALLMSDLTLKTPTEPAL